MAHRIITQIAVVGVQVVGRAFAAAWRQASANSQYARQAAQSGNPQATHNIASHGLTLDEACRILNVSPPKAGETNIDAMTERFKKLFDMNDPKKGGSFYLQSKILRARERIEMEVKSAAEAAEREAEMKEGWKPKVYK